jgi:hypothetical protein
MELHKKLRSDGHFTEPDSSLRLAHRDAQEQEALKARDQICAEVFGEQRWPQRWQGEMERYVTGGAIGVYEKGGAEEMEPGEAPAVSVLILIRGPSRGSLFPSPGVKSKCVHLMSLRNGDPGREARIRTWASRRSCSTSARIDSATSIAFAVPSPVSTIASSSPPYR